jgi:hypothetical protein
VKNRSITFTATLLVLACSALLPKSEAVNPAPDGGYAGGNTAEGQNALFSLTSGTFNTAVGLFSLRSNTTANFNTGIGAGTLFGNTADENTAIGAAALFTNTVGSGNTANGAFALFSNTSGRSNSAVGSNALVNNTTGSNNTAIGTNALSANATGFDNIALGDSAGGAITTAHNVICIGLPGADVSNACFIGNIRGVQTVNANAIPVLIDSEGQLGTLSSSRRFKKEIKPMDSASEAILALKPVTFQYKNDKENIPQFGLIAEEVAEVNPGLVVRDKEGKSYSVRYDQVNAMLLNEFLKEHRKVEKQQVTIGELKSTLASLEKNFEVTATRQQKEIQVLTVGFQKVSAQGGVRALAAKLIVNERPNGQNEE